MRAITEDGVAKLHVIKANYIVPKLGRISNYMRRPSYLK